MSTTGRCAENQGEARPLRLGFLDRGAFVLHPDLHVLRWLEGAVDRDREPALAWHIASACVADLGRLRRGELLSNVAFAS